MRLVIYTNVLVSALLTMSSLPPQLVVLWRAGRFDLLTTAAQLGELRRVTHYPKFRGRLAPAVASRMVNDLRALAIHRHSSPSSTGISPVFTTRFGSRADEAGLPGLTC